MRHVFECRAERKRGKFGGAAHASDQTPGASSPSAHEYVIHHEWNAAEVEVNYFRCEEFHALSY